MGGVGSGQTKWTHGQLCAGFVFTYGQKYFSGPMGGGRFPHRVPAMDGSTTVSSRRRYNFDERTSSVRRRRR